MATLRSFIFLDQLQPQTMCYLGHGSRFAAPPQYGGADHRWPRDDIEALTDIALKEADVQGGILVVERQFGYLEIPPRHRGGEASASGAAALKTSSDAMPPKILPQIITRIDPITLF
jgi:hypothetical protein